MKTRSSIKAIITLTLISVLAASLALAASPNRNGDEARIHAPHTKMYGKTLTEWTEIYWRWYIGTGGNMEQSKVGCVQLMPLPNGEWSGNGTLDDPYISRGQLEVDLPAKTPIVLPLYAWTYERYEGWPAVPDDMIMSDTVGLASGHPTLVIDGKTIITDANKAKFYVPTTYFDPIVDYPTPTSYGSVATFAFHGVTYVSPPLAPGTHVIRLYEPLILQPGESAFFTSGFGMIYVNTWIVNVAP